MSARALGAKTGRDEAPGEGQYQRICRDGPNAFAVTGATARLLFNAAPAYELHGGSDELWLTGWADVFLGGCRRQRRGCTSLLAARAAHRTAAHMARGLARRRLAAAAALAAAALAAAAAAAGAASARAAARGGAEPATWYLPATGGGGFAAREVAASIAARRHRNVVAFVFGARRELFSVSLKSHVANHEAGALDLVDVWDFTPPSRPDDRQFLADTEASLDWMRVFRQRDGEEQMSYMAASRERKTAPYLYYAKHTRAHDVILKIDDDVVLFGDLSHVTARLLEPPDPEPVHMVFPNIFNNDQGCEFAREIGLDVPCAARVWQPMTLANVLAGADFTSPPISLLYTNHSLWRQTHERILARAGELLAPRQAETRLRGRVSINAFAVTGATARLLFNAAPAYELHGGNDELWLTGWADVFLGAHNVMIAETPAVHYGFKMQRQTDAFIEGYSELAERLLPTLVGGGGRAGVAGEAKRHRQTLGD